VSSGSLSIHAARSAARARTRQRDSLRALLRVLRTFVIFVHAAKPPVTSVIGVTVKVAD
jgi:hypothetical protein